MHRDDAFGTRYGLPTDHPDFRGCTDCGAEDPADGCDCDQARESEMDAAMLEREEFEKRCSVTEAVERAGFSYLSAAIDLLAEDDSITREEFEAAVRALGFETSRDRSGFVVVGERVS